jgi:hypothetical protein
VAHHFSLAISGRVFAANPAPFHVNWFNSTGKSNSAACAG